MSQPPELMDQGGATAPRHGFQGDRGAAPPVRAAPRGLTIAVSREAGARGGSIARRVGKQLGWQLYDQELLEYMAQDAVARQGEALSPAGAAWVERRLAQLRQLGGLEDEGVLHLARTVLALAAQGEVVLLGRGAGCILPAETTLNVRVVAPLVERVAYMGQWLRLPAEQAAEKVRQRDEQRAEFVVRNFRRSPGDVHQYDMVLSSTRLGEEGCAELIARAAQVRWEQVVEAGLRS